MAKCLIDSSLICIRQDLPDDAVGDNVLDTLPPPNIDHPQWVNGQWQEYSADDDPLVQASDLGDGAPLVYATPIEQPEPTGMPVEEEQE